MWQGARFRPIQKTIAICSEILPFLCTYTFPHMHVQLRMNFSSRALLKPLRVAVCHAANSIVLSLQLTGFLFPGGAGKGKPWRETGHLGGPIQNRYKTDMKVEFGVQILAKPIQEKN